MDVRAPADPPDVRRPRFAWAGYAACAWALAFALLSFYWAAGGMIGVKTLSTDLRHDAEVRSAGFVALVWATGVLKVGAGLLALALVQRWGSRVPRRLLLVVGWGTGALLTLYGGMGLVSAAVGELGIVESIDPSTVRWYLLLWEPYWVLGGLLFLAAAWHFRQSSPPVAAGRG